MSHHMVSWTDSHNHLHDLRLGDAAPVIAAMKRAGVARCVVNATCEADWQAVGKLALDHPDFILPAFGIHPWKAHTTSDGWRKRLAELLDKHPQAVIGECGLDKWVEFPSIEDQMPIFKEQLELSRETRRPLVIHCLKAWGVLLDALAAHAPPRFLMHSFGGSLETARQLIPLGAWFSFSGHFLHPRKAAMLEVFCQLPRERILLETDAPDMLPPSEIIRHPLPGNLNHPANLPSIGQALASALGMTAEELAALTHANAAAFFALPERGVAASAATCL
jgi:TatD DNase family protein